MTTQTFLKANVKEFKKHLETLYKLSLLNLSKPKRSEYWLDECVYFKTDKEQGVLTLIAVVDEYSTEIEIPIADRKLEIINSTLASVSFYRLYKMLDVLKSKDRITLSVFESKDNIPFISIDIESSKLQKISLAGHKENKAVLHSLTSEVEMVKVFTFDMTDFKRLVLTNVDNFLRNTKFEETRLLYEDLKGNEFIIPAERKNERFWYFYENTRIGFDKPLARILKNLATISPTVNMYLRPRVSMAFTGKSDEVNFRIYYLPALFKHPTEPSLFRLTDVVDDNDSQKSRWSNK